MKNELINKLQELRDLAAEAFVQSVQAPRYNMHYSLNSVLYQKELSFQARLLLAEMVLNENRNPDQVVKGSTVYNKMGMPKGSYNRYISELVNQGYVKQVRRGFYKLNRVF